MSRELRIDFVSPPFAGHLYPALDLARRLKEQGFTGIRVLSTAGAQDSVNASGFPFVEILPGRDQDVWEIANTRNRVGSNPIRMWRQVQHNLALMGDLQSQLRTFWSVQPPDLVIADFVVPVAGLTAQGLGIPWWTGMPSPCALETPDGTPAYLGGWRPRHDSWGRLRDWLGRRAVRVFKTASAGLFSKSLKALSIPSLYRSDGTEVIYSPEQILAYGMREFEFNRTWPNCLDFIGPLVSAPSLPSPEIPWNCQRKAVLVTLGTHLLWAKESAIELVMQVARAMPEIDFHFSRGQMGMQGVEVRGNLTLCDSIPYDQNLSRYAAAIIHGGTGITYACIQNGIPMLVWPHDYDQFDHAARIVHHQLGLRLTPSPQKIVQDLGTLLRDQKIRQSVLRFQAISQEYDPTQAVMKLLHRRFDAEDRDTSP